MIQIAPIAPNPLRWRRNKDVCCLQASFRIDSRCWPDLEPAPNKPTSQATERAPELISTSLDLHQNLLVGSVLYSTMKSNQAIFRAVLAGAIFGAALLLSPRAFGHCDTMDGPVILAAKAALHHNDITPVLKWVKKDDEAQIKATFTKTLAVRAQGTEARELADQFFFETLVRIHRAGEGAPFTGLKPAGTPLEPPIREADNALETGSVDKVVKLVTEEAATGIRKRFAEAREKKQRADENVEAGREFVAAYVEYVHYVEGLHETAQGAGAHHEDTPAKTVPSEHNHNQ
jgi:hypothetical protein